jgi:hypothetical protein
LKGSPICNVTGIALEVKNVSKERFSFLTSSSL